MANSNSNSNTRLALYLLRISSCSRKAYNDKVISASAGAYCRTNSYGKSQKATPLAPNDEPVTKSSNSNISKPTMVLTSDFRPIEKLSSSYLFVTPNAISVSYTQFTLMP